MVHSLPPGSLEGSQSMATSCADFASTLPFMGFTLKAGVGTSNSNSAGYVFELVTYTSSRTNGSQFSALNLKTMESLLSSRFTGTTSAWMSNANRWLSPLTLYVTSCVKWDCTRGTHSVMPIPAVPPGGITCSAGEAVTSCRLSTFIFTCTHRLVLFVTAKYLVMFAIAQILPKSRMGGPQMSLVISIGCSTALQSRSSVEFSGRSL
mmetsp:Transcript_33187/g.72384  ORF Transcript_33187/g.72384 Transcript_33187/m.72384 type:complete len:207 (-) Transcript_33187:92-712(-)